MQNYNFRNIIKYNFLEIRDSIFYLHRRNVIYIKNNIEIFSYHLSFDGYFKGKNLLTPCIYIYVYIYSNSHFCLK